MLQLAALVVAVLAATDLHLHGLRLVVVAIVGVLAAVLSAFSGDIPQGVGALADIVVAIVILSVVLRRVLRHERVTVQTLYGAVCAYFLIGLMFGSIYSGLDSVGSEPVFGTPVSGSVYSYFSFITLTTLGFGDYAASDRHRPTGRGDGGGAGTAVHRDDARPAGVDVQVNEE